MGVLGKKLVFSGPDMPELTKIAIFGVVSQSAKSCIFHISPPVKNHKKCKLLSCELKWGFGGKNECSQVWICRNGPKLPFSESSVKVRKVVFFTYRDLAKITKNAKF